MPTRLPSGLIAGLLVGAGILVVPPPDGLPPEAWRALAVAMLMAIWWTTDAIPISATALLPLALFPLLGIMPIRDAAAPYANPLVYLFLGGFLVAAAMQRWDLHRRIALNIAVRTGAGPSRLVAGFMLATAFLSMWISNTATAMMMLPIALSVIAVVTGEQETAGAPARTAFGTSLLLGIAYAASIGGMGTLVGTPPNAFLSGFFQETYDIEIGFAQWMLLAMPVVVILLPVCWFVLTQIVFRSGPSAAPGMGHDVLRKARDELGTTSSAEWRIGLVFASVALLWMARPLLSDIPGLSGLSDPGIAIAAGILLFIIPAGPVAPTRNLLIWDDTRKVPWGVLILFGGGLSLASAISKTGLAAWLGAQLGDASILHPVLFVLLIAGVVILLTEITSNLATTAAFLPVIAAVADGAGIAPLTLAAPAAMAASCAFMLPVATPPNAIMFGSERLVIRDMMRAGIYMNLLALFAIGAAATFLVPIVFGN